jgi:hypothetical protein
MDLVQFILNQLDKPVKMVMHRFNLDKWSCRHCDGTGVCRSGWNNLGDKHSCNTCIREFDSNSHSTTIRVRCSVCNGTGRETNYILREKNLIKNNHLKQESGSKLLPLTASNDEQGGTGQPATHSELKSEGRDKPQPESKPRPR